MTQAVWITGLPGSGKSTIAQMIKDRHPDWVVLRMDELRKVVTPEPTYSESEREIVYRCLVYTAKLLTELGHNVLIDATGNMRRWRDLARDLIPDFAEVYLRCSSKECSIREAKRKQTYGAPKDIYDKAKAGWPVPGVNVPYEEPVNPEVTVNTEEVSPEEAVEAIEKALKIQ